MSTHAPMLDNSTRTRTTIDGWDVIGGTGRTISCVVPISGAHVGVIASLRCTAWDSRA